MSRWGTTHQLQYENTVKTIIETCPELLATKDGNGMLPIHSASTSDNVYNELEVYIPLLAEVGMKYEVGGKEGRGGLLISDGSYNPLQNLARWNGNKGLFEQLRNVNCGPLFVKEDICDYRLLFYAFYAIVTTSSPKCF